MILSAQTIEYYCQQHEMISPYYKRTVRNGKTFGLSAAGYDIRIDFGEDELLDFIYITPGEFTLAASIERFNIPHDILGVVHDKSSWARKGLTVQNTVIEPGWRGYLTLELTNHSDRLIQLNKEDPIAQIIFHKLDYPTIKPYDGKYQDQKQGPQEAIEESS